MTHTAAHNTKESACRRNPAGSFLFILKKVLTNTKHCGNINKSLRDAADKERRGTLV
jgi:hypothetical protein